MPENRPRHLQGIACEPAHHLGRGRRIVCQLGRDKFPRLDVDRGDEPQEQLGVLTLFFGRVRRFLNVEIRQHTHQSRPNLGNIEQRGVV